jgi:N-methylhydantoinase A
MLLGVDVGGTFTDAALLADGRLFTAKAPTTPDDQSEGVLDAVARALAAAGRPAGEVRAFAHGMTVATNALLEGRGARTALVATEGFADVVELGRQARASLYRLCEAHPAPLCPPELRFEAPERMGPGGPLRVLATGSCRPLLDALVEADPESVAVVLLHSYADATHERHLGELIAQRLPAAHVSLSHEVVGTFREYERAATTEVDAALSPLLAGYLSRLAGRAREAGLPAPAIMQSSGGLADLDTAASHAALTVLSGPAGGAAGAAMLAQRSGHPDAVCLDMGGTSCDVCVVDGGRVRETTGRMVGGRPLALPMLDVHTVGAGGGSLAWSDAGGALRVGPRSAGAVPGPACYGRGGHEPTVTDANLLLGYLDERSPLAGGVTLDLAAAERVVARLGESLGLDPLACAEGIVRVASAEMVRALRVMTIERGVDPRDYALLAFGGAGPLHAAAIADQLGITRIVCPQASGVLSALGLAAAERRCDAQRSVLRSGKSLSRDAVAADIETLAERARATLEGGDGTRATRAVAGRLLVELDLRYRGQAFELTVPAGARPDLGEVARAFGDAHEQRYGYRDPEGELELVTVRVSLRQPRPELQLHAAGPRSGRVAARSAVFAGRAHEARVFDGAPSAGERVTGPAIVALAEATLVVPPGWGGETDEGGTTILEREA